MEWIKCKDQPPPFDEEVLICEYTERNDGMYQVFSAKLTEVRTFETKDGQNKVFNFWSLGKGYDIESDYWMPKPFPPKS